MNDQPLAVTLEGDRHWVPVVLELPGVGPVYAVVDETHGNAIVATIGKTRPDDPEIDDLLAYHAQLIAGIPESAAFLAKTLQVLEAVVNGEIASRIQARKTARELLTSVRVMRATTQPPQPRKE